MVNYSNGKIYKIESSLGDKIYVGSTTKAQLSQRMTAHRGNYKCWKAGKGNTVTSFQLFEEYGVENCEIILLENCPCESKDQLSARERYYIKTLECVNKNIPLRTIKEYIVDNREKISEQQKQYNEANKDKLIEYHKQYRETNKEKIAECRKQYNETNKDKIAKYKKEYYQANHDKNQEYREENKEDILVKKREYYAENKEKLLERHKAYREANRDKHLEQRRARYQAKKATIV